MAILSIREVATELGRSADWWHRHWRRYVAEKGFPQPLHDSRPFVWDARQVEAWKATRAPQAVQAVMGIRPAPANDPLPEQPDDDDVTGWRARLEAAYGGG